MSPVRGAVGAAGATFRRVMGVATTDLTDGSPTVTRESTKVEGPEPQPASTKVEEPAVEEQTISPEAVISKQAPTYRKTLACQWSRGGACPGKGSTYLLLGVSLGLDLSDRHRRSGRLDYGRETRHNVRLR